MPKCRAFSFELCQSKYSTFIFGFVHSINCDFQPKYHGCFFFNHPKWAEYLQNKFNAVPTYSSFPLSTCYTFAVSLWTSYGYLWIICSITSKNVMYAESKYFLENTSAIICQEISTNTILTSNLDTLLKCYQMYQVSFLESLHCCSQSNQKSNIACTLQVSLRSFN